MTTNLGDEMFQFFQSINNIKSSKVRFKNEPFVAYQQLNR